MGSLCQTIIKPRTCILDPVVMGAPGSRLSWFSNESVLIKAVTSIKTVFSKNMDDPPAAEHLSFADLAIRDGLQDSRGRPAFDNATHFVSHAWKFKFSKFVDSLGEWLELNDVVQDNIYFWVDAFVVNQHDTQVYPQEWWSTRFMQAVGDIGNVILVLEPWDDPVPLKRAWVIWELYCTSMTGARLSFTMSKAANRDFHEALVESFEKVQTCLCSVDVSRSLAFHEADQDMIHKNIQRTIGFAKMNELVQTRVKMWLEDTARESVEQMKVEEKTSSSSSLPLKRLHLQSNLARFVRENGKTYEAEISFRQLMCDADARLGQYHVFTLSCLNQLAVTLQKSGRADEALEAHRDCMRRRRMVLGNEHQDVLQSASNLAVLISGRKPLTQVDFEEAAELYGLAIAGRERQEGADHPRTLYTMSNLGSLLSCAPQPSDETFDRAEALHERVVSKFIETLTLQHPRTLDAMHNQADCWLRRARFVEKAQNAEENHDESERLIKQAEEMFEKVRFIRQQKLGKEHPDTENTAKSLRASKCLLRSTTQMVHMSWRDLSLKDFTELNTRVHFREARRRIRSYGVPQVRTELEDEGFIDRKTGLLTTGLQPFNFFARIASENVVQKNMIPDQEKLGPYKDRYIVVCNRPEAEDMWNSRDPTWMGKASMSKRHRLLTLKDLRWEWFNALTFGLLSDLRLGIARLEELRRASLLYCKNSGDWPPEERIGLFVHVYAHCSVNSLHIHIVDLENLGPTFEKLAYKNLSLDDAIAVLWEELQDEQREATGVSSAFSSESGPLEVFDFAF